MKYNFSHIAEPVKILLLGVLFYTLTCLFMARHSYGQEASVSDFTVVNSESHLLLYMTVTDWLTEEMKTAIHNGVPITFAFYVDLFVQKNKWPDRKIKEYEFNHVMEFDSLKKTYTVYRHENGDNKTTASFEEARKLMSEINGFEVLPLDDLIPQTSYILRAKAKMARKTMPLYFHYLIPFSSPWEFETDWRKLSLKLAL